MKRSERDAWCAALEGDEYKQGRAYLTIIDTISGIEYDCCMGVLCKVKKIKIAKVDIIDDSTKAVFYDFGDDISQTYPPLKWNIPNGSLSQLNDTQKYTFKQIAAWIRENIPVEED